MYKLFYVLIISTFLSCNGAPFNCFDGPITTKELSLSSFQKLDLDIACEIILRNGTTQKVVIEAPSDLIADLENRSQVSNDTWKVRLRNNCITNRSEVKLFLTIPDLKELNIDGSAKVSSESNLNNTNQFLKCIVDGSSSITLNIVDVTNLDFDIDGNATIDLTGRSSLLNLKVDGNGTLNAHNLITNQCDIDIDGNTTANVNVLDKLNIVIDGNAAVCFKSNPVITSKISGVGKIRDCN